MKTTFHCSQRMQTRGITNCMVQFALEFGDIQGDKLFVNRKILTEELKALKSKQTKFQKMLKKFKKFKVATLIAKYLKQLKEIIATANKLLDKGGITVVAVGDTLLTTYDFSSHKHRNSY